MKTFLDCVPCFVKQALDGSRLVTSDEAVQERVLRRVLTALADLELDRSPPHMSREIHRIIREETGSSDPYADIKHRSTEVALTHLGSARTLVETASDPFEAAVRFAIAGNILDFALPALWDGERIETALGEALGKELAHSDIDALRHTAESAASILYIADNAGEIVLDRLLIEQLPKGAVTLAVRGGPVVNDATREDAVRAGLADLVPIVDTGSDAPGVILEWCSDEFRRLFWDADLVIAKGQANYETLRDVGRPVFFLTQIKCPVIARDANSSLGEWLCLRLGDWGSPQD